MPFWAWAIAVGVAVCAVVLLACRAINRAHDKEPG